MWATTFGRAKRLARIVFGLTLLAIGAALLVLPGPGILTLGIGLAILAAEFVWARRLLDRFKEHFQRGRDALKRPRVR